MPYIPMSVFVWLKICVCVCVCGMFFRYSNIFINLQKPEGQEYFLEKIREVSFIPKVTAYYLQDATYGGSS